MQEKRREVQAELAEVRKRLKVSFNIPLPAQKIYN